MSPVAAAGLSPVRRALANGVVLLTEHTATHPAGRKERQDRGLKPEVEVREGFEWGLANRFES